MFNLKQAKNPITPTEKQIRRDNVGPTADEKQPIQEKVLPHRSKKPSMVTTEGQLDHPEKEAEAQIIEKALSKSKKWSENRFQISVPPINVLVEKLRQNRLKDDWKEEKTSNWTVSMDDKKQLSGPKWPKNPAQHDKIVLNNDPRRFNPVKNMPVDPDRSKNESAAGKSGNPKPLVGGITTADVDRVVHGIKTGASLDYDTAIVAILKEAEQEKRELTAVERKAVTDLKIARTKSLLRK